MRQTTNLSWPTTPFGADQRPLSKSRPTLAAVTITSASENYLVDAGFVYLTVASTRTFALQGTCAQVIRFGYEVLTRDPEEPADVLVRQIDARLVACRRQAKYLVGHDLGKDLEQLSSQVDRIRHVPGIDGVAELWADRARKGRGLARMIDIAQDVKPYDCDHSLGDLPESGVAARLHSHHLDPGTLRATITRTLAVALIGARFAGRYTWRAMLDLDTIVAEAAWDQFADIEKEEAW